MTIYCCEYNLNDHTIEHTDYPYFSPKGDWFGFVHYDSQFSNNVYAESNVSREDAFLMVVGEISRVHSVMYAALKKIEEGTHRHDSI